MSNWVSGNAAAPNPSADVNEMQFELETLPGSGIPRAQGQVQPLNTPAVPTPADSPQTPTQRPPEGEQPTDPPPAEETPIARKRPAAKTAIRTPNPEPTSQPAPPEDTAASAENSQPAPTDATNGTAALPSKPENFAIETSATAATAEKDSAPAAPASMPGLPGRLQNLSSNLVQAHKRPAAKSTMTEADAAAFSGKPRKRPAAKSLIKRVQRDKDDQNQSTEETPPSTSATNKAVSLKNKQAGTKKSSKKLEAKKPTKKPAAKKAATVGKSPKKGAAAHIWEGTPDEPLEGGWPKGWIKRVFERKSGASAGHRDRYWYSPVNSFKFRSMVEVKKFMKALVDFGGDEDMAQKNFRKVQL